jgi:hypothetical protein
MNANNLMSTQAIITINASKMTNENHMIELTRSVENKLQQHAELVIDEILVLKKLTYIFLFLMLTFFFYLLAQDVYSYIKELRLVSKLKYSNRQNNLTRKSTKLWSSADPAQFEFNKLLQTKAKTGSFANDKNSYNSNSHCNSKSLFNNDKHIFK